MKGREGLQTSTAVVETIITAVAEITITAVVEIIMTAVVEIIITAVVEIINEEGWDGWKLCVCDT